MQGSARTLRLLGGFLVLLLTIAGIVLGGRGRSAPATVAPTGTFAGQAIPARTATATATATRGAPTPTPTPARAAPTATVAPQAARPTPSPAPRAQPTRAPDDGLPTIALASLPPEARETIRLIDQGGPYPYSRDGITFENRERLLPARPGGYYREFTVVTPGSADRGARRVIAGDGGELYYTDDHYESFRRVVR